MPRIPLKIMNMFHKVRLLLRVYSEESYERKLSQTSFFEELDAKI